MKRTFRLIERVEIICKSSEVERVTKRMRDYALKSQTPLIDMGDAIEMIYERIVEEN